MDFLANKVLEDIIRKVIRDELGTSRTEDILRRRISVLEQSQQNQGGVVTTIGGQVAQVLNGPPVPLTSNAAFEVDTNNDGLADGWIFGGTATSKTATLDSAHVYGAKCQKLTINAGNTQVGGTVYIMQTVPLVAGKTYSLSVFNKDDGVSAMSYNCFARINFADATYQDVVLPCVKSTQWGARPYVTFTAGANAVSVNIYLGFSVSQAGIAASAWFDAAILNHGPHPMPIPAVMPGIITEEALAGELFQIQATSNPAPSVGTLANLYDGDSNTTASFTSAGYIEFSYPVDHVFNKVMIELQNGVQYYVTYLSGGSWIEVCGSAALPKTGVAGRNTENFTSQIQTRRVRLNFLAGCTIKELKFNAYLLADEIDAGTLNLAKGLQIWNNATGSGVRIDSNGILVQNGMFTAMNALGQTMINGSGINADTINVGTLNVARLNLLGWVGIIVPSSDGSNLNWLVHQNTASVKTASSAYQLMRTYTFGRASSNFYAAALRVQFYHKSWGTAGGGGGNAKVVVKDTEGHTWSQEFWTANGGANTFNAVCLTMQNWPTLGNITVELWLKSVAGIGWPWSECVWWKIFTNDTTKNQKVS